MNASGGLNNSHEGREDGMTHAFVLIFASEEDRDYYVDHDPVHAEFKQMAAECTERIVVVDYEPSAL